ncbi:MAG TPA: protease complex subunit PrcB family protein [Rubrobacteraceae bacterium]|nr:protease complex subunit PrcB family protein [Rubrobacteraceae bacterium]
MVRVGLVVLLLLVAGCSGGEPSAEEPPEASGASEEPRDLRVERISSDQTGQGTRRPRAVVAPSATALSEAIGANVPDQGSGTYLAAYWGEKPTGGYSMSVRSARLEGDAVTVRLSLKEPQRGAILTQALTYPYAVAVIRELDPEGKDFSFVDEEGRELDWEVRSVGG